jgi:DNA-binding CsgD family transcriptional regulator
VAAVNLDRWAAPWPEGAPALTPLQHEIMLLVVNGRTNAQIAERLGMTAGNVAVQVVRIVERLGLATRGEITPWAMFHGLL